MAFLLAGFGLLGALYARVLWEQVVSGLVGAAGVALFLDAWRKGKLDEKFPRPPDIEL